MVRRGGGGTDENIVDRGMSNENSEDRIDVYAELVTNWNRVDFIY